MARRKAKAGAVFIHAPDDPRGPLITTLSETLAYLHPEGEKKLRAKHGPAYLYMADAVVRGDGDEWYEEAPGEWSRKADALLNEIVADLQKSAPAYHHFSAIRGEEGMIEWGYWESERNPEEEAEDDLLYGGFRENPKLALVQETQDGTIYKYRGRHILVDGSTVQIARTGKGGMAGILAEWESNQPFPRLEAVQVVDLMHEAAKGRKRKRKANPVLPAAVTEDMQHKGTKCAGVLFKCGAYMVELQPIGEYDGSADLTAYDGMTAATVIAPDDTVLQTLPAWGGARALAAAKKVIEKQEREDKKNPKRGKPSKGLSFMRRMMK